MEGNLMRRVGDYLVYLVVRVLICKSHNLLHRPFTLLSPSRWCLSAKRSRAAHWPRHATLSCPRALLATSHRCCVCALRVVPSMGGFSLAHCLVAYIVQAVAL